MIRRLLSRLRARRRTHVAEERVPVIDARPGWQGRWPFTGAPVTPDPDDTGVLRHALDEELRKHGIEPKDAA